jgi:hypothetical protein
MPRIKLVHHVNTPSSHFALEIEDWDAMLSHLEELGIQHVRTSAASGTRPSVVRGRTAACGKTRASTTRISTIPTAT